MDLDEARRRLNEERESLEHEIETFRAELSESLGDTSEESLYDQHMAETAAVTFDRELEQTLEENSQAGLAQVNRALRKLEEGTYGFCDSCKKPISDERLQAVPHATLCIDCKRREERGS